jgi:Acyl-protein synthetase, LuxE
VSVALQTHLRDAIARAEAVDFDRRSLEVFAFQFERNGVYRAYCEQQKWTPATVRDWREIPAVPTSAFKEFVLTCFPAEEAVAEFHTSGTTRAKAGKHFFKTLELYEAAIRRNFATYLLSDDARLPMFVLTPSPQEAPHSSLSHMMGVVMKEFGAPESDFYISHDGLLVEKLIHDLLEAQWAHQAVFLLGTAFAFVHLFDYCAKQTLKFQLADGSRAMETGGFKGRSREMTKTELYVQFETHLGLPPSRVVNEYGMTELSSQFYDETLRVGHQSDRKTVPRWARVVVIDPNTGREAAINERGLVRVYDLANLWSVMCVQTEDLGILREDGKFEVLGRAAGAEVRGCSLTAETLSLQ